MNCRARLFDSLWFHFKYSNCCPLVFIIILVTGSIYVPINVFINFLLFYCFFHYYLLLLLFIIVIIIINYYY